MNFTLLEIKIHRFVPQIELHWELLQGVHSFLGTYVMSCLVWIFQSN